MIRKGIHVRYGARPLKNTIELKDNSPFVTSVLLKIIKGDIPSYCIKKFICYNNNAKEKLENFGINHKKIEINQGAYY